MIELALKARLPIIGVHTDDPLNYKAVLEHLTGRVPAKLPSTLNMVPNWSEGVPVYLSDSMEFVTPEWYKGLAERGRTLVVINPAKPSPLMFDGGQLPTPLPMLMGLLSSLLGKKTDLSAILPVMKGLSLKTVGELVALTRARTEFVNPQELRRTRGMMSEAVQGMSPIDTSYDFYELPTELESWLKLNTKYFMEPKHKKLVPRGLLLEGPPGTGKTMAAKAVATTFKCPLYRLDVPTVLDKFIGASEARVARILMICEREAPCVLLIDEVEKLFGSDEANGVTTRILSQLLWWLQEHQSQVFTIMTTNDSSGIPPELYRSGRVDARMTFSKLNLTEAKAFAGKTLKNLLGKTTLAMTQHLNLIITAKEQTGYSQAELVDIVIHEIKAKGWL